MARIRTLKPEFWPDEKLADRTPLTRLVFLGLISQADDAGRLVDNVKLIDGLLFPATPDSCAGPLQELAGLDRILRYQSESGQKLIQIVNWDKHQKVQHPSAYVLPGPPGSTPHEDLMKASGSDPRPTTSDLLPPTSDPRGARPDGGTAGGDLSEIEQLTAELVAACNNGLAANAKIPRFKPLSPKSAWNRRTVSELLAEGVTRGTMLSVIEQGARSFVPDEESPQIRGLGYFLDKVRQEHRRQAATTAGSDLATRRPAVEEIRARQDAAAERYATWKNRVLSRLQEEPDSVRAELEKAAKEAIGAVLKSLPKGVHAKTLEAEQLRLYGDRIGDPKPSDVQAA